MHQITSHSLLLFCFCLPVAAQDANPIRWNLQQGDKLQATLQQTTEIETNIDTRKKKVSNDMLLIMDWQIDKVDGDRIEMTQSINRIKLEIHRPSESAIETTLLDTDSPGKPTPGLAVHLHEQVAKLVGTEFTVAMSSRGEILEVDISEASKATIRQAPASMKLRELLTESGLKEILGQSAIIFPEEANNKDWSVNMQTNNALGKVAKETTIKYEGKTDRNGASVHTFAVTSSAKIVEASTAEDAPTMDDYSGWGTAWFANDAKPVFESNFENRMNLSRNYRDQKIISTVSTTTKMQVVKQ